MAQQKQQPDNTTTTGFPVRGIDVENPFDMQPPFTTPMGVNVRSCEPITLRTRGGQRPGLLPYLPKLATGSVIQHLDFIVDPQADALSVDFEEDPLPFVDYMDDPSTNNLKIRNNGRRVRVGGSGRGSNKNVPSIQRQPVTINWDDPASISPGTPLGPTQLNATATVGILPITGTFKYTPPSGAVLPTGAGQPLLVDFTPTDIGLYLTKSKTVHISVGAEIAYIQGRASTYAWATWTTRTLAYTSPVTAGNLLVAVFAMRDNQEPITCTDSQGNSWTRAGTAGAAINRILIFYAFAGGTGANTVTLTTTTGFASRQTLALLEYSNVATSSPVYDSKPGDGGEIVDDPSVAPYPFNTYPVNVRTTKRDLVIGCIGRLENLGAADWTCQAGWNSRLLQIGANDPPNTNLDLFVFDQIAPLDGSVQEINVTAGGIGYDVAPSVSFTGGGGSGATATANLSGTSVSSIDVNTGGSGYTSTPTVVLTPVSAGSGATAAVVPKGTPKGNYGAHGGDVYKSYGICFKQV